MGTLFIIYSRRQLKHGSYSGDAQTDLIPHRVYLMLDNSPYISIYMYIKLDKQSGIPTVKPSKTATLKIPNNGFLPITVGNLAFHFDCTPVGRTSDSMTVPT